MKTTRIFNNNSNYTFNELMELIINNKIDTYIYKNYNATKETFSTIKNVKEVF